MIIALIKTFKSIPPVVYVSRIEVIDLHLHMQKHQTDNLVEDPVSPQVQVQNTVPTQRGVKTLLENLQV